MTRKRKIVVLLTAVILLTITLICIFVWTLSVKITQDMEQQYNQKYKIYDFSNEDVLIKYFDNAYSYDYYNYDKPIAEYQKGYDSEDEISYVITVTIDGILTKEAVMSEKDTERFGAAPVFTKNLTEKQVEALKDEIIKSDIKVILYEKENKSNNYSYRTAAKPSLSKYMEVYADGEKYKASYELVESNTSLNTLYKYLLALLSDEDNKKFEETVNSYYNDFEYDFEDTENQPFIMYSEIIFYADGDNSQSFMVSVTLDSNGKVDVTGDYTENVQKFADKFNKYLSNAKSEISEEEVKEVMQAVVESNFIRYAEITDEVYEPTVSNADDGSYSVCQYITVRFNGKTYCVADSSISEITELKNKYLGTVLNEIPN